MDETNLNKPERRSTPKFFQDAFIFWGSVTSFLLIIILVLVILFKLEHGSEMVPLHYNVLVGVDVVNPGWHVFILPILAILVLVYNYLLGKKLFSFEPFASHLLILTSSLTSAIMLAAALALTSLP